MGLGFWAAVDAMNNPETMYQIRRQIKFDKATEIQNEQIPLE